MLDSARRTALGRMTAECAALGGDGVVAAQLTMAPFPAAPNCLEFKVIGTAVRAAGPVRPRRPFTSHLDGVGFAKLVTAGWIPVDLLVGMSIGVRHDDYGTRRQARSWSNQEMGGWTALVQQVRADARTQLYRQGSECGDGVILDDGTLRVWEEGCLSSGQNNEQTDHVAESTLIGTAIARFAAGPVEPRTLTVMPLNGGGDRLRRRLARAARR
ncbi:heavy metal-binding domain-containing protein [Streptacidiphilus monticola]